MMTNLDRVRDDLARLKSLGHSLLNAMQLECRREATLMQIEKLIPDKAEREKFIKEIPDFRRKYDGWYTESLAVIKQLIPDRIADFRGLYEKPKNRKELSYTTYTIQDYMQGTQVTRLGDVVVDTSAALPQMQQQVAILSAAAMRLESSLFDIRKIVQADLFDGELAAARELFRHGFLRAAGAVAGVVLERHLRSVCADRGIEIKKKNPGIADLNDLLKSAEVIDITQWRHISLLGDYRNICGHDKKADPTAEQVKDLIDGVEKVSRTVL